MCHGNTSLCFIWDRSASSLPLPLPPPPPPRLSKSCQITTAHNESPRWRRGWRGERGKKKIYPASNLWTFFFFGTVIEYKMEFIIFSNGRWLPSKPWQLAYINSDIQWSLFAVSQGVIAGWPALVIWTPEVVHLELEKLGTGNKKQKKKRSVVRGSTLRQKPGPAELAATVSFLSPQLHRIHILFSYLQFSELSVWLRLSVLLTDFESNRELKQLDALA